MQPAPGGDISDPTKLPLCLAVFGSASLDALNPGAPSLSSLGEPAGAVLGTIQFNNALAYAASRPNYLGGQGLLYPLKSSTYRSMVSESAATSTIGGALLTFDLSLLQGLIVETAQAYKGQCRAF